MDSKVFRIVAILLSLFAVIYFGWQISAFLFSPYTTEIASSYLWVDQIDDLSGVIVKEEQVITETYSGVIQYNVHNAKKIVEGSEVATVYQTETDLVNNTLKNQLSEKISLLKGLQTQKSGDGIEKNLTSSLESKQLSLLYDIQTNNYASLQEDSMDYLGLLLQQQQVLGNEVNYQDEINALQSRAESLEVSEGTSIKAPMEGYFTSNIDGYETVLTEEALGDMSVDTIQELIDSERVELDEQYIGKVITSTNWKLAAIIPTKALEKVGENQKISLMFSGNTSSPVEAKIEKIYSNPGEEYSTILISSNILNDNIIDLRKEKPSIYLNEGEGIRVDSRAIRIKDGETGVYVKIKNTAYFRKINVVYSMEDFVISEITQDSESLQLYDEVIVEAKGELYDNKPL